MQNCGNMLNMLNVVQCQSLQLSVLCLFELLKVTRDSNLSVKCSPRRKAAGTGKAGRTKEAKLFCSFKLAVAIDDAYSSVSNISAHTGLVQ